MSNAAIEFDTARFVTTANGAFTTVSFYANAFAGAPDMSSHFGGFSPALPGQAAADAREHIRQVLEVVSPTSILPEAW